jgi:hypothetical protein
MFVIFTAARLPPQPGFSAARNRIYALKDPVKVGGFGINARRFTRVSRS